MKYENAKIDIICYDADEAFVVATLSNGGTYTDDGGEFGSLFGDMS